MLFFSASSLQRPYGGREKSLVAIFMSLNASWQVWESHARFAPTATQSTRTVCSWTLAMFSEFVASLRHLLRHRRMEPSRARYREPFKAGQAARLGVPQLYPDIRLEEVRSSSDAAETSLWLDSLLWVSEGFNRAATSVNDKVAFPP